MIARRLAGAANMASALLLLYLGYVYPTFYLQGCRGCSINSPLPYDFVADVMLVVGLIYLIDGGACLAGKWLGFPVGAILSLAAIPLLVLKLNYFGIWYIGFGVTLAVVAVILDVIAMISKTKLPEQNHPLNLPVFG